MRFKLTGQRTEDEIGIEEALRDGFAYAKRFKSAPRKRVALKGAVGLLEYWKRHGLLFPEHKMTLDLRSIRIDIVICDEKPEHPVTNERVDIVGKLNEHPPRVEFHWEKTGPERENLVLEQCAQIVNSEVLNRPRGTPVKPEDFGPIHRLLMPAFYEVGGMEALQALQPSHRRAHNRAIETYQYIDD